MRGAELAVASIFVAVAGAATEAFRGKKKKRKKIRVRRLERFNGVGPAVVEVKTTPFEEELALIERSADKEAHRKVCGLVRDLDAFSDEIPRGFKDERDGLSNMNAYHHAIYMLLAARNQAKGLGNYFRDTDLAKLIPETGSFLEGMIQRFATNAERKAQLTETVKTLIEIFSKEVR